MEPEGLLPCLQQPATSPYPKADVLQKSVQSEALCNIS